MDKNKVIKFLEYFERERKFFANDKTKDLVSIVIPNYNQGYTILGAIGSALSQSYGNVEVVVLDNGSNDGSWELLKFLADIYPIRIYRNFKEPRGHFTSFGEAFRYAKGKFVRLCMADEILNPEYLETKVPMFLRYPDISFVMSRYGTNYSFMTQAAVNAGLMNESQMIDSAFFIKMVLLGKMDTGGIYNCLYKTENIVKSYEKLLPTTLDKVGYDYGVYGYNDSVLNLEQAMFSERFIYLNLHLSSCCRETPSFIKANSNYPTSVNKLHEENKKFLKEEIANDLVNNEKNRNRCMYFAYFMYKLPFIEIYMADDYDLIRLYNRIIVNNVIPKMKDIVKIDLTLKDFWLKNTCFDIADNDIISVYNKLQNKTYNISQNSFIP